MRRRDNVVQFAGFVTFVLSENGIREGGRPRDPNEMYVNAKKVHYYFFGGKRDIIAVPDGWHEFTVRFSGGPGRGIPGVPKNGRSVPATELGAWLNACGAQPGDVIVATPLEGDRYRFRFVCAQANANKAVA